jgi:hypothetical protein
VHPELFVCFSLLKGESDLEHLDEGMESLCYSSLRHVIMLNWRMLLILTKSHFYEFDINLRSLARWGKMSTNFPFFKREHMAPFVLQKMFMHFNVSRL